MEIAQEKNNVTVQVPGGAWHKERGPAEKDSARYEFGSAHTVLSDPVEPFRGRLVETLSWTDFGWVIVLLLAALASFVGGGWFFRDAMKVQAAGGKKPPRTPSLTPRGTPRGSPTVTPPKSHPPVE